MWHLNPKLLQPQVRGKSIMVLQHMTCHQSCHMRASRMPRSIEFKSVSENVQCSNRDTHVLFVLPTQTRRAAEAATCCHSESGTCTQEGCLPAPRDRELRATRNRVTGAISWGSPDWMVSANILANAWPRITRRLTRSTECAARLYVWSMCA